MADAGVPPLPVEISIPTTETRTGTMGMQSYTAYCVKVVDFGKPYQIERRFDDFKRIHEALSPTAPHLPPLPEKKWMASTDQSVVEQRRPAFEKMLQEMLRSEAVLFEKDQQFFKFLELQPPTMAACRFLCPAGRIPYLLQVGKLLDPKFEKEHAYRLGHPSVVRVNLSLLELESLAGGPKPAPDPEPVKDEAAANEAAPVDASPSKKTTGDEAEALHEKREAACVEMLRYAVQHGGDAARKAFLGGGGLAAFLRTLCRAGVREKRKGTVEVVPDSRVRAGLNAVVTSEGERFEETFAHFMGAGGVRVLVGFHSAELLELPSFADLLAKLLWRAWEPPTQTAFLSQEPGDGLRLLSALFGATSTISRVLAGLLVSALVVGDLLEIDLQMKSAAGLEKLLEDVAATEPVWAKPIVGTESGENGAANDSLTASLGQVVGRSDKGVARLLACVQAPCGEEWGGGMAQGDHPRWAACALALWCLLKLRLPPAKIAGIRPILPVLAAGGHQRAAWLAGELLLLLASAPPGEGEPPAQDTAAELRAVDMVCGDQLLLSQRSLHQELSGCQQEIEQQRHMVNCLGTPGLSSAAFGPVEGCIGKLAEARKAVAQALESAESRQGEAQLEVEALAAGAPLEGGRPEVAGASEMRPILEDLAQLEENLAGRTAVLAEFRERRDGLQTATAEAQSALQAAESNASSLREKLTEAERQVAEKRREAQSRRAALSSDTSVVKEQLERECQQCKQAMEGLRQKREEMQKGELGGKAEADAMAALKEEAAKLRERHNKAQAQLQSLNPQDLQEQANQLDEEARAFEAQRDNLRAEQQGLEDHEGECRQYWQSVLAELQGVRRQCDEAEAAAREADSLVQARRQALRPLWKRWSAAWLGHLERLQGVQRSNAQLRGAVQAGWETLHAEQGVRSALLAEAQRLRAEVDSLICLLEQTPVLE